MFTSPSSDQDFAVLHPLRPLLLAGVVTLVAYACGVGVVWFIARGLGGFGPWIAAALVFVASWAGLVATMAWRRPGPRETVLIWGKASLYIICVSQLLVAWAIWGFFPALEPTARMMLAGMFLVCSPAQLIASPENVMANRFGILASAGSLVAWFALRGGGLDLAMAGFSLGIGGMFFVLAGYLPGTVIEAVAARRAAEEARARLETALQAVAEERDAKTRFIAAASHDLGQPLQAAGLFFDQVLRATDPAQRARAEDGVRRAFAAADQLISHMLNHLRLEADAVDPYLVTLELGPVLARVAAQFAPAAAEAGARITVLPSRVRVRVDRVLFERALGNLVANAITHSGAKRILVGVRQARGQVRVWVIDNGAGIARVDVGRVFDDYYRGDSGARVKGGFGLGLASVRRIARLMGGAAGLEPAWISGAAFYLEFPKAEE